MAVPESKKLHDFDKLLTHALERPFCPICLILQNKTTDMLCRLQFDAVRNEEVNVWVISAGGYCHFHFWYLHSLASAVTNAQLLEGLLQKVEKQFLETRAAKQSVGLAML